MSTVVSRIVRSSPHRDSTQTWDFIVDLLTGGNTGKDHDELLSVAGVAASIVTDRAPADSAIVVTCDGPRTRIYCLYDEDAIGGSSAKENLLGYEALKGNWSLSLPCLDDDLEWVQGALKKKSSRITARSVSEKLNEAEAPATKSGSLSLDVEAFLKS